MKIKAGLLFVFAAAALLWATPARAEYVCTFYQMPPNASPTFGSAGVIQVTYYLGPNCTGGFKSTVVYCSNGATNAGCATTANCSGANYLYDGPSLNHLADMLLQSILHDLRVYPDVCGAGLKAGVVDFYAN